MHRNITDLKKDIYFETRLRDVPFTFYSTWGLFSPEQIDEGTTLLLNEIEVKRNETILDLGCGYGPIGLTMAKLSPGGNVHLVDKDFVAIECAKKNAAVNNISNCKIYLSNGFSHIPKDMRFDTIASNLPAKASKEFYWILFNDAKQYLKPGGKLYVVTISGLKEFIKRNFQETFGNYKKLKQGRTYTVAMAVHEPSFI